MIKHLHEPTPEALELATLCQLACQDLLMTLPEREREIVCARLAREVMLRAEISPLTVNLTFKRELGQLSSEYTSEDISHLMNSTNEVQTIHKPNTNSLFTLDCTVITHANEPGWSADDPEDPSPAGFARTMRECLRSALETGMLGGPEKPVYARLDQGWKWAVEQAADTVLVQPGQLPVEPRISRSRIKHCQSGRSEVLVKLEGNTELEGEICAVSYYPDELHFEAGEFLDRTLKQARELHYQRDLAYLQS